MAKPNFNKEKKYQSQWLWSMIPRPLKRKPGYGVIVLKSPKYFRCLQDTLGAKRAYIGVKGSIFLWIARRKRGLT